MDGIKILILLLTLSTPARAAIIEMSGMLSYSRADFADGYKSSSRRYTGSVDFKFTAVSAIEFEYTSSVQKISYPTDVGTLLHYFTQEAITYDDKVYSFNWVQNLVPSSWILQPYLTVGGGKMIRKYTKQYPEFGLSESVTQNVTTGVAGGGCRLFLTKSFALKGEMKTYVPKFHFKEWRSNQSFAGGLSWTF